jgi:hypothetical protein
MRAEGENNLGPEDIHVKFRYGGPLCTMYAMRKTNSQRRRFNMGEQLV